jgi:2-C-methyl-D-erythritol 4-phosphate cytidylyltransferase
MSNGHKITESLYLPKLIFFMVRYAVIAAGGMGSRMGAAQPKQFLTVAGKPLLEHTLAAFLMAYPDIRFVVVLPEAYLGLEADIRLMASATTEMTIVAGGETRFQSVKNGLSVIPNETGLVFVHDAARCLVSPELIRLCSDVAEQQGSAIPVSDMHNSLRQVTDTGSRPLNRDGVKAVQTPQTFRLSILKEAFELPYQSSFTDEATVVEAAGYQVQLVNGESRNIKITTPFDLLMAELVLKGS